MYTKKSWTYHYQTDLFDGKTRTQPSNPKVLIEWVAKHYPENEVPCAYEAGFSGYSGAVMPSLFFSVEAFLSMFMAVLVR